MSLSLFINENFFKKWSLQSFSTLKCNDYSDIVNCLRHSNVIRSHLSATSHTSFAKHFEVGTILFRFQFHRYGSVQFSHSVVSDSLRCHEPQHARPPCSSPTSGVHPNPVHRVDDAIQTSYPLLSPSPPALNLSQHHSLFQ